MKKIGIFTLSYGIFLFLSAHVVFAVFSTQSNVVCTKVGNASQTCSPIGGNGSIVPVGEGGEKIASAARQLAGQLVHSINPGMPGCDPGVANGGSRSHYIGFHCWLPDMTLSKYDQARDPDYFQCTEFVWAAFEKAGFGKEVNLINGNAQEWVVSAQKNPTVFQTFSNSDASQLRAGDIISLGSSAGDVGHVAIVIEKEDNVVKIAQSATDRAIESWDIKNGILVPYDQANRASRTIVKGFIRLIKPL